MYKNGWNLDRGPFNTEICLIEVALKITKKLFFMISRPQIEKLVINHKTDPLKL